MPFCSACGNEPELTPDGWRGHNEDCELLGETPDVVATHCSDCGRDLHPGPGSWRGHDEDCERLGEGPDYVPFGW